MPKKMTIAEAQNAWCPDARVGVEVEYIAGERAVVGADAVRGGIAGLGRPMVPVRMRTVVAVNRVVDSRGGLSMPAPSLCMGPQCMAWDWNDSGWELGYSSSPSERQEMIAQGWEVDVDYGWKGLPEQNPHMRRAIPLEKRTGQCGKIFTHIYVERE